MDCRQCADCKNCPHRKTAADTQIATAAVANESEEQDIKHKHPLGCN